MRSMARWVLPVLVGPSTAVTPAPRVRDARQVCWGKTDGHYASGLVAEHLGHSPERAFCITMRRRACAWLSFRTSLERIAPESLTPELYGFVHGDIWRAMAAQPQDGVAELSIQVGFGPPKVNDNVESRRRRRVKGLYCVFEPLLVGAPACIGTETNSEPQAPPDQSASAPARDTAPAPGSGDRRQPHFHVALFGEISDRRARREYSRRPA